MKRMRYEIKEFVEELLCDCGEVLQSSNRTYTTYPAQRDYTCPKCGYKVCLSERQWPGIYYEKVGKGKLIEDTPNLPPGASPLTETVPPLTGTVSGAGATSLRSKPSKLRD